MNKEDCVPSTISRSGFFLDDFSCVDVDINNQSKKSKILDPFQVICNLTE